MLDNESSERLRQEGHPAVKLRFNKIPKISTKAT